MGDITIGVVAVLLVAVAMLFMHLRSWRNTKPAEEEQVTQPFVTQGLPNETIDKMEKHVRRYTLALEQCEKGEERRNELQRGLTYWKRRIAAENMRGGE